VPAAIQSGGEGGGGRGCVEPWVGKGSDRFGEPLAGEVAVEPEMRIGYAMRPERKGGGGLGA
jgi:hypothetical protein